MWAACLPPNDNATIHRTACGCRDAPRRVHHQSPHRGRCVCFPKSFAVLALSEQRLPSTRARPMHHSASCAVERAKDILNCSKPAAPSGNSETDGRAACREPTWLIKRHISDHKAPHKAPASRRDQRSGFRCGTASGRSSDAGSRRGGYSRRALKMRILLKCAYARRDIGNPITRARARPFAPGDQTPHHCRADVCFATRAGLSLRGSHFARSFLAPP